MFAPSRRRCSWPSRPSSCGPPAHAAPLTRPPRRPRRPCYPPTTRWRTVTPCRSADGNSGKRHASEPRTKTREAPGEESTGGLSRRAVLGAARRGSARRRAHPVCTLERATQVTHVRTADETTTTGRKGRWDAVGARGSLGPPTHRLSNSRAECRSRSAATVPSTAATSGTMYVRAPS